MTETKFTKGTWVKSYDENGGYDCMTAAFKINSKNTLITTIDGGDYGQDWDSDDYTPTSEMKANAHLIAAAPDLYEALVVVLEEMQSYQYGEYCEMGSGTLEEWVGDCEFTSKANAALAKARGEDNG